MLCFHCWDSVDQQIDMSINASSKLRQKKAPNLPNCQQSPWAAIDLLILIAVIGASGFLLLPHVKLLTFHTIELVRAVAVVMRDEVFGAPMAYWCLGLGISCIGISVSTITVCLRRKCGKPGCRGLRAAGEFDIQLETEECVKNSGSRLGEDGGKRGVFELRRDYHRELESELKKMAPINGRAVLLFRARCGCSVGRMEVPGPKKPRKVKK